MADQPEIRRGWSGYVTFEGELWWYKAGPPVQAHIGKSPPPSEASAPPSPRDALLVPSLSPPSPAPPPKRIVNKIHGDHFPPPISLPPPSPPIPPLSVAPNVTADPSPPPSAPSSSHLPMVDPWAGMDSVVPMTFLRASVPPRVSVAVPPPPEPYDDGCGRAKCATHGGLRYTHSMTRWHDRWWCGGIHSECTPGATFQCGIHHMYRMERHLRWVGPSMMFPARYVCTPETCCWQPHRTLRYW